MKKLISGAVVAAALAAASTSYAADMAYKAAPAAPPPPSWTGVYIGFNAGAFWRDDNYNSSAHRTFSDTALGNPAGAAAIANALGVVGTTSRDFNSPGFIGGFQIGYNWQFSNWLLGFEADIQMMKPDKSKVDPIVINLVGYAENYTGYRSVTQNFDYFGTVRGRLGFLATPNLLVFGTGGLAYADVNLRSTVSVQESLPFAYQPVLSASNLSDTRVGWTAGGGIEWKLDRYWSVKGEYLYYDLGTISGPVSLGQHLIDFGGALYGRADGSHSASINGNIVRFGVNYKFGDYGKAPVVAKY